MSLVACQECGKNVSSEASACPQCGHPTLKAAALASPGGWTIPSNVWIATAWGSGLAHIIGWTIIVTRNSGIDALSFAFGSMPSVIYCGLLWLCSSRRWKQRSFGWTMVQAVVLVLFVGL